MINIGQFLAVKALFASLHLPALIKRPLGLLLLKMAADKLIARDNMELATRGSNPVSGYPVAAFDKTAIGPRVDKTVENGLARPLIN